MFLYLYTCVCACVFCNISPILAIRLILPFDGFFVSMSGSCNSMALKLKQYFKIKFELFPYYKKKKAFYIV